MEIRRKQIRAGMSLLCLLASALACRADPDSSARPRPTQRVASATPTPRAVPEDCGGDGSLDVLKHSIDLALQVAPPSLSGTGKLLLRARRATSMLVLDAHELKISRVAIGSSVLDFKQVGDRVCAALPRAFGQGEEVALDLAWQASVAGTTPQFSEGQVWAGYSTMAWMPTIQDPAQRASLSLRITTNAQLKVVASGRESPVSTAGVGLLTHSFSLDRPTPPFLYGFAVGNFVEAELAVGDVTLRALGPPGADLNRALTISAAMYRLLQDHLGTPLPSTEYTQIFVTGDAAQEGAGLAFLSASALADERADPHEDWIFSHELAHQWFGWLVPCADFSDFWLNEGFATFLVAAVKEQRWGHAAYEHEVSLWRTRSSKVHAEGRDAPVSLSGQSDRPRAALKDSELQARGVTYSRGALVLYRLRALLGDAAFWSGIRHYLAARAGQGARTDDLRASLEATSGRDLRPFFQHWVYASAPEL
jgi:aminopeptidase N